MKFKAFVQEFAPVNFERSRRFGAGQYDPSLVKEALRTIGNPQIRYKTIHVAGTSGKGSVASYLARMLQADGYRTGLYRSPHLLHLKERISIDGECISEKDFDLISDEVISHSPANLTFFDLLTMIAFVWFDRRQAQWTVIETGLGGRLDSTNQLRPEFSVFTAIGMDHTAILGDTLAKIAKEKAGILKPGGAAFSMTQHPLAEAELTREAIQLKSRLTFYENGFSPNEASGVKDIKQANYAFCRFVYERFFERRAPDIDLSLPGILETIPWSGGAFLFDGAHNELSLRRLAGDIQSSNHSGPCHIYINTLRERDLPKMISLLAEMLAPLGAKLPAKPETASETSPSIKPQIKFNLLMTDETKAFGMWTPQDWSQAQDRIKESGENAGLPVKTSEIQTQEQLLEHLAEPGFHLMTGSLRLYPIAEQIRQR